MIDELRALIELEDAGSIVRAADRMCRTPSAVTRKLQRLENALGVGLIDRSVRPPRLTPIGKRVSDHGRRLLREIDEFSASVAPDAEPQGTFRLGVAHALADEMIVSPLMRLIDDFPRVELALSTDLTGSLLERVKAGALDAALVFLPESQKSVGRMEISTIARDEMCIVGAAARFKTAATSWDALARSPWVLNPQGCLLRDRLSAAMASEGAGMDVAAEVHNLHLQREFVRNGFGCGLLPRRFVERGGAPGLRILRPPGFRLELVVALIKGGPLGSLDSIVGAVARAIRGAGWLPKGASVSPGNPASPPSKRQ